MAENMTEIRWHARGGQGAKTAAILIAEVALAEGKYGQGFPDYGPERMGAPMRGFTRISDAPIFEHCAITSPDVVIVLDSTLIGTVDVVENLREDGVILVNTQDTPAAMRDRTGFTTGKLFTLDATKIALDEIGRNVPNTPMVGALLKATGILKLDTVITDVRKKFGKKFSEKIIQGNINAVKRAYEEVQEG